jgi:hypothetical protein
MPETLELLESVSTADIPDLFILYLESLIEVIPVGLVP